MPMKASNETIESIVYSTACYNYVLFMLQMGIANNVINADKGEQLIENAYDALIASYKALDGITFLNNQSVRIKNTRTENMDTVASNVNNVVATMN